MEDDNLLGDVDAWFDAFERGDFFVAWHEQQEKIRTQEAACGHFFNVPVYDASMD